MTNLIDAPFLTDLDSRMAVKGSRDPLGIQPVWTRMGRRVVGNLTMASSSLRDFTATLLGYWVAERVADRAGAGSELATFLRWEQLADYSRAYFNKDWEFRGTERVRQRLGEGARVTLSGAQGHQVLSNQKIYGLWGLYSVPSRASGLLEGDPPRLTPAAREFVERNYLPVLAEVAGPEARRLVDLLRQPVARVDLGGAEGDIAGVVARVLRLKVRQPEVEFYERHLVCGGPADETHGRQAQLAELIRDTLETEGFAWSPLVIGHLVKAAMKRGTDWEPLAHSLDRIRHAETVLAPASTLFSYIQGLDGQICRQFSRHLVEAWGERLRTIDPEGFAGLRDELGAGDTATGDRWVAIGRCLANGDYERLLELLLEQNAAVMAARGGAPWVERRFGSLHVRFRDEQGALPPRKRLPELWLFPYFLDPLRTIAAALR